MPELMKIKNTLGITGSISTKFGIVEFNTVGVADVSEEIANALLMFPGYIRDDGLVLKPVETSSQVRKHGKQTVIDTRKPGHSANIELAGTLIKEAGARVIDTAKAIAVAAKQREDFLSETVDKPLEVTAINIPSVEELNKVIPPSPAPTSKRTAKKEKATAKADPETAPEPVVDADPDIAAVDPDRAEIHDAILEIPALNQSVTDMLDLADLEAGKAAGDKKKLKADKKDKTDESRESVGGSKLLDIEIS